MARKKKTKKIKKTKISKKNKSKTPAKIFEKKGEHTRAAISVNSLPFGVAVDVDAIFELN